MYNQEFIDTMDKINSLAKTMGYTNGIAWARYAMENSRLNAYDFGVFENCHHLRNLMAHGCSRDINISVETMKIARIFLAAMTNPQIAAFEQSIVLNEVGQSNPLEVREGDYVIAMHRGAYSFCRMKGDGILFRVVGKDKKLKDLRDGKEYTVDELNEQFYLYIGLFVIREDMSRYARPYSFYVIGAPHLRKDHNGKCMADIHFVRTPTNTDSVEWVEVECYLAHKDCFRETNPKHLFAMKPGETQEQYLHPGYGDLPF